MISTTITPITKHVISLSSSLFLKNIIINAINNVIIIPNDKFILKIKALVKFFEFRALKLTVINEKIETNIPIIVKIFV